MQTTPRLHYGGGEGSQKTVRNRVKIDPLFFSKVRFLASICFGHLLHHILCHFHQNSNLQNFGQHLLARKRTFFGHPIPYPNLVVKARKRTFPICPEFEFDNCPFLVLASNHTPHRPPEFVFLPTGVMVLDMLDALHLHA